MSEPAFRYRAFISYSHRDKAVAAWVQGALERYHIPAKLVGKVTALGPVPARLHPLFRDRDELPASGDLGSELMAALRQSMFLILICSPASARSRWVGEEILNFKRMHGEGRVLALICDGEPGRADNECFPLPLQFLIGPDGELTSKRAEPIAADIRPNADGRRLAKFKLIAGLTGLRLDELIQREAARRAQRLTLIATASVIGMVLALGLAFYANTQRLTAIEQRRIAETESAASRATADYLVGTFELANPATDNPRTITALTILGRSADRARTELANQPAIQLRLIDTVARAYSGLGLFDEAGDTLAKSQGLIDASGAEGAAPLLTLANVEYRRGDLDQSLTTVKQAQQRLQGGGTGNIDRDQQLQAKGEQVKASVLFEKNELGAALAAYDRSLAYLQKSRSTKPEALARSLNNRGLLLTTMARYDDAAKSLQQGRLFFRRAYGMQHVSIGNSDYAIARNLYLSGDPKSASANVDEALAIYTRVLDADNPKRAAALSLKGQILRDLKRPVDANAALGEAVAIYRKRYGKPHYLVGITEVYQALAMADSGNITKALAILDDAKLNYDIGYGKLHPNHGDLLINRATILAKAGRIDEARRDCADGLAIVEKLMDHADGLYDGLHKTCAAIKG